VLSPAKIRVSKTKFLAKQEHLSRTEVCRLVPIVARGRLRRGVVSVAGSVLLVKTATAVGLDRGLATALAPWRKPHAVHDPGKILLDLALAVAIGGDCLADIRQLRSVPAVFGHVASDPTVSRLIDALATDPDAALAAVDRARAAARHQAWHLAGKDAPDHSNTETNPLAVDLDASLVTAHSEKESASPTYINVASGFTRCWRLSITGCTAPVSR